MVLRLASLFVLCGAGGLALALSCRDDDTTGGGGTGNHGGNGDGGDGGEICINVGPCYTSGGWTGGGDEGSAGPPCYDEELALLLPGTEAEAGQDVCTPVQTTDFKTACLDAVATKTTCSLFSDDAANEGCVHCLVGDTRIQQTVNTPVLLLFTNATGVTFRTANVTACNAVALDLPACAIPVAALSFCVETACDCAGEELGDCADYAVGPDGICADLNVLDPSCDPVVAAPLEPECAGATFEEQYNNVAAYFCGP